MVSIFAGMQNRSCSSSVSIFAGMQNRSRSSSVATSSFYGHGEQGNVDLFGHCHRDFLNIYLTVCQKTNVETGSPWVQKGRSEQND